MKAIVPLAKEYTTKTFMDVGNRAWALRTPEAIALRRYVVGEMQRSDIWDDFEITFLEKGLASVEGKRMIEWFHDNSCIMQRVRRRPSDAEPFDLIYRYSEPKCEIDHFAVQSKGAVGIHLRLLALMDRLPGILQDCIEQANLGLGEKFRILDVGCGYGDAIREVLVRNPDIAEQSYVCGVDIDERSIREFQQRVDRDGLSKSFDLRAMDIQKAPPTNAHLVLLIGMLCPTKSRICIKILRGLRLHAKPGGILIYSTVQIPMIQHDPLLNVLMRGIKWRMDFKTAEEATRVGTEAGWKVVGFFDDALGFNRMTIATNDHGKTRTTSER